MGGSRSELGGAAAGRYGAFVAARLATPGLRPEPAALLAEPPPEAERASPEESAPRPRQG
jgi:hypothetical protein